METMQTPTTRAEFERRFHLLQETMRQRKILFPPGVTSGIEKVRLLPNGRIDFLSVNESARLLANMMNQFEGEAFKARLTREAPKDSAPEHP